MLRLLAGLALAVGLLVLPAAAAPTFPPLTGRVVDNANILPADVEARLTQRLADLEIQSGRQLVVATLPSLQGYEIEDYGYQLGRAWGVGSKEDDDGALFIVAPNERKVRIEVGYGLEPVLTDALSSVILQTQVLPRFKAGDMPGGIVAGTNAIAEQLALPADQARARAAQATAERQEGARSQGFKSFIPILIFFFVLSFLLRRGRGRRRGGDFLTGMLIGALTSGGRGGGWSSGGGGFSGGGGSFGGGGSSGSW